MKDAYKIQSYTKFFDQTRDTLHPLCGSEYGGSLVSLLPELGHLLYFAWYEAQLLEAFGQSCFTCH